jgi:hypothetical protein
MRVKIAYTVELDQVESETAEIMSRAAIDLDMAYQEIINLQNQLDTGTGDPKKNIESIHFARVKLAKADQILEDCYLILNGLQDTRAKLEEKENEIQDG